MKEKFKNVQFFSATTDIWSRGIRSFIAVTVHYFQNNNNSEVETSFIACEHFEGRHTHDKVAEKLRRIFERYGILEKVFLVTTDGGTNYTAAFKYFGENYESMKHLAGDEDVGFFIGDSHSQEQDQPQPSTSSGIGMMTILLFMKC